MSLGTKEKKFYYTKHFLLDFFFLRDFGYFNQFVTTYFHSSELYTYNQIFMPLLLKE